MRHRAHHPIERKAKLVKKEFRPFAVCRYVDAPVPRFKEVNSMTRNHSLPVAFDMHPMGYGLAKRQYHWVCKRSYRRFSPGGKISYKHRN